MKRTLTEKAYAKINLFLEVTGKREDGYHTLDTVMHTVSLCDLLSVTYDSAGQGIRLTCDKKFIPTDGSNVVTKCAKAYLERAGCGGGVEVLLSKRIPVAAGLGGGSADGAAVLRALDRLTGARLGERTLCTLAAAAGADVPFLLRGGCMRAGGIGEILTPAPMRGKLHFVLAIGSRGSQTPAAYRALDESGHAPERSADAMVAALAAGDVREVCAQLYNAFEGVIFPGDPEAAALKARMTSLGARGALMSGSGASVFGVFPDADGAQSAVKVLRGEGFFAAAATSIL